MLHTYQWGEPKLNLNSMCCARTATLRQGTHRDSHKSVDFDVSPTRKAPRGVGERPKVSQHCFLHASCHFLSMPEHPYAVRERPGSVGMASWAALATPRECHERSRERPGGSKIVLRSGPSHPRVPKNVAKAPSDPENLDFLKIDVQLMKNIRLWRRRRPRIDPKWTASAPE